MTPSYFAPSKCLIFPSLEESFGLPLIEAVDIGLDVISSDKFIMIKTIPSLTFNPNDAQSIEDTFIQKYKEGKAVAKAKIKNNISELIELIL